MNIILSLHILAELFLRKRLGFIGYLCTYHLWTHRTGHIWFVSPHLFTGLFILISVTELLSRHHILLCILFVVSISPQVVFVL
jgi:hypothetical protein